MARVSKAVMRVFEVTADVRRFQTLLTEAYPDVWWPHFDGKLKDPCPIPFFLGQPQLPRADFLHHRVGTLGVATRAQEALLGVFEGCAQLLPLVLEEEPDAGLALLNITTVVSCLDVNLTVPRLSPNGVRIGIEKYVFRSARFEETSLFKIPQNPSVIMAVTGVVDEDRDFKHIVESEGLTGLVFTELWSDEG